MRIVAVEEHFTCQDLLSRIDCATLVRNGWPAPETATFKAINPPALADTGRERIAAMDAAGIRMQVLSVPGPGAEIVSETRTRIEFVLGCERPPPSIRVADCSGEPG
jgi:uncharacterized protein